ncbi:MAG: hypothetical protein IKK01_00505 [Clostridia bacterium]|nr:hypothetical protein [Clostridia bacterium]
MKKTLSLIMAIAMILSMSMISVYAEDILLIAPAPSAPEGTAITNADEFAAMAADGKYYLANDITISATYASDFAGVLDGNGKTITTSVPVFAVLGSATIKNLKLAGEIAIDEADAGVLTTSVAGGSTLLIDNVENNCKLTVAKKKDVGGFIGVMNYDACYGTTITIKNSTNNADITGGWRVGGFLGYAPGSDNAEKPFTMLMENCVNNGTITSTESYCGGLVGRFGGTKEITGKCCLTITHSTNNGNVTAAVSQVGGFCGYLIGKMVIEHSVNNANLTATAGKNMTVAGFIGVSGSETKNYGDGATVRYCVNNGKISSTSKAGGIVGNLGNSKQCFGAALIENCINYGEIAIENCYSDGTTYAAGIAGYMYGGSGEGSNTIQNCLNLGKITGETSAASGKNYAAGILAYVNGNFMTIANNLNLGEITLTSTTTSEKFTHTFFNNSTGTGSEACVNNYSVAVPAQLLEKNGSVATSTTVITAADAALATKLGAAWKMGDKTPEPIIEGTIGGNGADFSIFEEKPAETEPADPGPTGDSALIFAVVAIISILGVATVAKRREN